MWGGHTSSPPLACSENCRPVLSFALSAKSKLGILSSSSREPAPFIAGGGISRATTPPTHQALIPPNVGGWPQLRFSKIPVVRQPALKPRSGGMGKPGTAVPGRCKWNHPSPLQRTARVSQQPQPTKPGQPVLVSACAGVKLRQHPSKNWERPVCPRFFQSGIRSNSARTASV